MNLNTDNYIHHHDALKLPNGNMLAIVWERVSTGEAISQGRNPENVAESGDFWYDGLIEVNPHNLEIVWEWSARHHTVLDQILLSSNYLSEIWTIDHSTTPYESAGHTGGRYGKGGDFLYRWGNPANYDRGAQDDRMLFRQHDAQWIDPGFPGALFLFLSSPVRSAWLMATRLSIRSTTQVSRHS